MILTRTVAGRVALIQLGIPTCDQAGTEPEKLTCVLAGGEPDTVGDDKAHEIWSGSDWVICGCLHDHCDLLLDPTKQIWSLLFGLSIKKLKLEERRKSFQICAN